MKVLLNLLLHPNVTDHRLFLSLEPLILMTCVGAGLIVTPISPLPQLYADPF